MALFYRGAGVGTHWHANNAVGFGFTALHAAAPRGVNQIINHIRHGTAGSPYISLTRSYGVAWSYAMYCGHNQPTQANPAYVYEIELDNPLPAGLDLFEPVYEIANASPKLPHPMDYEHDGTPDFLLGIVSPATLSQYLQNARKSPPGSGATTAPANLNPALEAMVRSLRDVEILAIPTIPANNVLKRYAVW